MPDPAVQARLVLPEPVRLAIGLERGDGPADTNGAEGETGEAADLGHPVGPPLVEPDDRRPERRAGLVGHHDGRPLGRQGDAGDRAARSGAALPQPRARRADRPPVDLRVLLGPTRLRRDVRDDRDPGVPDDRAARIEDEGPDALRPDVDREDVIAAHRRPLRSSRASVRSTPGFIMRSGSNRAETSRSTPSPSSPFSPANQRRWSRPTPCWWLIVPPWRTITSLAASFRRRHRSRVSSGSAARRKTYVAYRLEPLG